MVSGWWQDEDHVHAPPGRSAGGNVGGDGHGDGRPLVLALTDDRFERVNVRLDLEQDGRVAPVQAQVGRPPAGPRHGRFDLGTPAGVSKPEERLDEPGVRGVVDERRGVGVQAQGL